MKCGDGSCLSKTYFCDGTSDCEDGSDEPVKCTCREYLKLSEPSKICDGVVHCRDSSDERFCPCNESNFKCARLYYLVNVCFNENLYCDVVDRLLVWLMPLFVMVCMIVLKEKMKRIV